MRSRPPKPLKRANGLLKTNSRCHRAIHGVQALPKAVERSVTSSDPRTETYPGGGFALELALTWAYMSEVQSNRWTESDCYPSDHECTRPLTHGRCIPPTHI